MLAMQSPVESIPETRERVMAGYRLCLIVVVARLTTIINYLDLVRREI